MNQEFNYHKALEELEKIVERVEDPSTGLGEIDSCIKRSEKLIDDCRTYLRSAHETVDSIK